MGGSPGPRGSHALLLCLLGAAVYANTLDVPFYFDDLPNIVANPHIRLDELAWGALLEASFGNRSPRPVAHATFALNHLAGGYEPAGYHVVNIAIHCANGVLVYLLAWILLRRQLAIGGASERARGSVSAMALFAAALFVAHPLQTQSVTYVVQRMNSLAVMFYLLAFLLFLRGRMTALRGRRIALWAGATIAWGLSLGSKQIAVTLPFAIWLTEWFFFRDLSLAWLRRWLALLLLPLAAVGGLALVYLGADPVAGVIAGYEDRGFTLGERLRTQLGVLVLYLSLMVWPLPGRLSLVHPVRVSQSLVDPITTLLSLLLLLVLLALAAGLARRQRLVSYCILWFFLQQLLESSVIALEMVFEHRCYLPMFGFALLVSWLLFSAPLDRRLAVAAAAVVVGLLSTGTFLRNETWRDPVAFWTDVVERDPDRGRAHYNLGGELLRRGRADEAIHHYREALRVSEGRVEADAHSNLGVALMHAGRFGESERHLLEARRIDPENARVHVNLGTLRVREGRLEEATESFRDALHVDPENAAALHNLAYLERKAAEAGP